MPEKTKDIAEFKKVKPAEFNPLHSRQNPNNLRLRIERTGDPGIYHEVAVRGFKDGKPIADILVGLNEQGELRVLITSDGDGESDHAIAVFPQKPREQMVEKFN